MRGRHRYEGGRRKEERSKKISKKQEERMERNALWGIWERPCGFGDLTADSDFSFSSLFHRPSSNMEIFLKP